MNRLAISRQGESLTEAVYKKLPNNFVEVTVAKRQSRFREKEEQIGQRIRLARNLRNWSLGQLAEQLGLSYQQIQKYEKGVNRVSASMLLEISQSLNLSLEFFYPESENAHESHPTFEQFQTAFQIHAIGDESLKSSLLVLVKRLSS